MRVSSSRVLRIVESHPEPRSGDASGDQEASRLVARRSMKGSQFATPHFATSGFDIGTETLHPYGSSRFLGPDTWYGRSREARINSRLSSSVKNGKKLTNEYFWSVIDKTVKHGVHHVVPQDDGRRT